MHADRVTLYTTYLLVGTGGNLLIGITPRGASYAFDGQNRDLPTTWDKAGLGSGIMHFVGVDEPRNGLVEVNSGALSTLARVYLCGSISSKP